jgi:hypothetical protein
MAGQIIRRGDNVWLVRVFVGRRADGKRQYQNHTVRGLKKEAQAWLTDALKKKRPRHPYLSKQDQRRRLY